MSVPTSQPLKTQTAATFVTDHPSQPDFKDTVAIGKSRDDSDSSATELFKQKGALGFVDLPILLHLVIDVFEAKSFVVRAM